MRNPDITAKVPKNFNPEQVLGELAMTGTCSTEFDVNKGKISIHLLQTDARKAIKEQLKSYGCRIVD